MVGVVRGGTANRLVPTGPFEESAKVSKIMTELAQRAQEGGASSIMFLPQKGVKYDAYAFAYHTGLAKEMNITGGLVKGAALRGTVVINISGHATGGMADRITGWAERELNTKGRRIGDDAKRFLALRGLCEKAATEFQSDYQKTKSVVSIDFEGVKLDLRRDLFEQMQKAGGDGQYQTLATWGNDALRKMFAATNSYNVRIRTPDGQTTELRNLPRNNPDKIEMSTRIAVEIPAGVEGNVVLEAWPTGSAEVGGYVEARRYNIHVGKEPFSMDKAIEVAEKYQAAHANVRWDTDHEDDDLEKNHVSPSPYPYQDF